MHTPMDFEIRAYQKSFFQTEYKHNIENSLGVLITALELGVDIDAIKNSFENFKGIGRRLELIADVDNKIIRCVGSYVTQHNITHLICFNST
jgi:UDP-N-acetylmuramate-alanine ligase